MFTYFSVWTDVKMAMTLCPSLGMSALDHRLYETKATLYALCVCSVGGLYVTHVHPRHLYVSYLDHRFDGLVLTCLDFLGHHLLLGYFYWYHVLPYRGVLTAYPSFTFHILWMPLLYILCMPYDRLYGFRTQEVVYVSCLSLLMYVALLSLIHSLPPES